MMNQRYTGKIKKATDTVALLMNQKVNGPKKEDSIWGSDWSNNSSRNKGNGSLSRQRYQIFAFLLHKLNKKNPNLT